MAGTPYAWKAPHLGDLRQAPEPSPSLATTHHSRLDGAVNQLEEPTAAIPHGGVSEGGGRELPLLLGSPPLNSDVQRSTGVSSLYGCRDVVSLIRLQLLACR